MPHNAATIMVASRVLALMYKGTLSDPSRKVTPVIIANRSNFGHLLGRISKHTLVYTRFRNLPFTPDECHS